MNWQDAAEAKLDLYHFWRSDAGKGYGRGFARSLRESSLRRGDYSPLNPLYDHIAELEERTMHRAAPIWVAPEIMDIAEAAAPSFQPEEFVESDLLTPCGFVLLPRGFYITDVRGELVSFRAFAWYPVFSEEHNRPGIWISMYSHYDDLWAETDSNDLRELLRNETGTPWSYLNGTAWFFGSTVEEMLDRTSSEGHPEGAARQTIEGWWKFVQTLMRLSMQTITERRQERLPRQQRRRLQRAKMEDFETLVITLRRPRRKSVNEEGSPVDWQHRWFVEAFWRNQWFPSLKRHRQIYISTYMKGPEDKPLLIHKERAYNFVK